MMKDYVGDFCRTYGMDPEQVQEVRPFDALYELLKGYNPKGFPQKYGNFWLVKIAAMYAAYRKNAPCPWDNWPDGKAMRCVGGEFAAATAAIKDWYILDTKNAYEPDNKTMGWALVVLAMLDGHFAQHGYHPITWHPQRECTNSFKAARGNHDERKTAEGGLIKYKVEKRPEVIVELDEMIAKYNELTNQDQTMEYADESDEEGFGGRV